MIARPLTALAAICLCSAMQLAVSGVQAKPRPVPATAQAAQKKQAEELFRQGRKAFKSREFQTALQLFQRSEALFSAPGTRLNIALTLKELGKQAEALDVLDSLLEDLPKGDKRRKIAITTRDTMVKYVPRLMIQLKEGAPAGAVIKLDGHALSAGQLGQERRMNPGNHSVVVEAAARDPRRYDLTLEPGAQRSLTVDVGDVIKKEAPVVPAPAPVLPSPAQSGPVFAVGIGAFALGGAAAVAGAVTGGIALSKKDDLEQLCPEPSACTAEGVDIAAEGKMLSLMSTILLAAGGGVAGTGIIMMIADAPSSSTEVAASPLPGGGFVGLTHRF